MSGLDLTAKYGRRQITPALNAAIRAEIPGGEEVLELLTKTYRLANSSKNESKEDFREIFELLQAAQQKMKAALAKKYQLKFAEGKYNGEN